MKQKEWFKPLAVQVEVVVRCLSSTYTTELYSMMQGAEPYQT